MRRHTRTDADGRYRVSDREGQTYFVSAIPAPGTGYLKNEQNALRWPSGATELVVDLSLRRGIALKGRVVDEATGEPIAHAGVAYQPRRMNKEIRDGDDFRTPVSTDADGRFVVTGLRGPGVAVAEGPSSDYIRHAVVPQDFGYEKNMQVHGLARFEVPAEGNAPEILIKLKKGFALEARAVDPAGKPLDVRAWSRELKARFLNNWQQPEDFADGVFRLPGAEPGRSYRIYFWSRDGKFARAAEVVVDPNRAGPVEVRLEPTARIKGRVVDRAGMPVEGSQILLRVQLVDTGREVKEGDYYDQAKLFYQDTFAGAFLKQSYPAEFDHPGLFPGLRHFVTWYIPADGKPEWHAVEPLAPGEVRDLGDIRSDREGRKDAK